MSSMVLDLVTTIASSLSQLSGSDAFFEPAQVDSGLIAVTNPEKADSLQISVFPGEVNVQQLTRASHRWSIPVNVAIHRRLTGATVDQIMESVEVLASHFIGRSFTAGGFSARANMSSIPQFADRELFHEKRVFESVLVVDFDIVRVS